MKRCLLIAVILAALVPAHAIGADVHIASSTSKRAFEVKLNFLRKPNGRVTEVDKFRFLRVPMNCESGGSFETTARGGGFGPMKVKDKRFHKRFPTQNQGSVRISGEFKAHYTKLVGTLRVKGDYPGIPAEGCDSGKLNWSAQVDEP